MTVTQFPILFKSTISNQQSAVFKAELCQKREEKAGEQFFRSR